MSYIKNNRFLLLIIAALLIVNIGLLYYGFRDKRSQGHKKESRDPRAYVKMKLEKEVGFSTEQLAAYDDLRTKHFDSLKPMFDELRIAKDNFFNLLYQPQVSDSVISASAAVICGKQEAIDLKMIRHFRNLRGLATEEQRPKMDSFLQNITKRMAGGGRRGPGPEKNKDKK